MSPVHDCKVQPAPTELCIGHTPLRLIAAPTAPSSTDSFVAAAILVELLQASTSSSRNDQHPPEPTSFELQPLPASGAIFDPSSLIRRRPAAAVTLHRISAIETNPTDGIN